MLVSISIFVASSERIRPGGLAFFSWSYKIVSVVGYIFVIRISTVSLLTADKALYL